MAERISIRLPRQLSTVDDAASNPGINFRLNPTDCARAEIVCWETRFI
jgi:hypothetical protein